MAIFAQHRRAGRRESGSIALQASQDGHVATVHDAAAKSADVAGARTLVLWCAATLSVGRVDDEKGEGCRREHSIEHLLSYRLSVAHGLDITKKEAALPRERPRAFGGEPD